MSYGQQQNPYYQGQPQGQPQGQDAGHGYGQVSRPLELFGASGIMSLPSPRHCFVEPNGRRNAFMTLAYSR